METYRIRYVDGPNPARATELVRELAGVELRAARMLVETRGIILDEVGVTEARRVAQRFEMIGAEVDAERSWRHVYAYDPASELRGDQLVERLRAGDHELAVDEGMLGAQWTGTSRRFDDDRLTQQEVLAQLGRWEARGLEFASTELAVLEAVSARDEGLEARLREEPGDEATHLIYGDWLQAHGDPRGQLIALQHALSLAQDEAQRRDLGRRERSFRKQHASHLFGPLRGVAQTVVLRWSLGFIDAAFVHPASRRFTKGGSFAILRDLLRLPVAARMTRLVLLSTLLRRHDLEALLCSSEVVASLRELELELPRDGGWTGSRQLWRHLRKLRKLTLHSSRPPLGSLDSPSLEHLELRLPLLPQSPLEESSGGELPRLRTLTLEFINLGLVSGPELGALLALPELGGVRELALRVNNEPLSEALVEVLTSVPRVAAFEVLDLSGCMANEGTRSALRRARDDGRLPERLMEPAPC